MARDQSGGAALSSEDEAARRRVGRKHLAQDGCPRERPPAREPQERSDDRPTGIVSEDRETGRIDPLNERKG